MRGKGLCDRDTILLLGEVVRVVAVTEMMVEASWSEDGDVENGRGRFRHQTGNHGMGHIIQVLS